MPLTEINVTNPTTRLPQCLEGARCAAGGRAPAAALARDRPRPAGGGPSQAARLPAAGLSRPMAGVGEGRRAMGGLVGGLHRAGPAGVRRRPVRPGRIGPHHRGLERAGDPVAGAGRRPVQRQDAGARVAAPSARHGRARAGARGRRAGRRLRCLVAGAGEGRGPAAAGRAAVARRADRLAGRAGAQDQAGREPARGLPRHLGRDRPAVGPGEDRRQHRGLARSGAAGRGPCRHRRRPGRALPLCLARPRALPLAAHVEARARGRGGERAAAHRPRGGHAGEAAGARLGGSGGDGVRHLPGTPARRDAAGGRAFGRLARQGTGHGGAAGRRVGVARLDGEPAE